jgi:hypothetical protein
MHGRSRVILIAVSLVIGPHVVHADDSTIYFHAGSWDAFSGHTDQGQDFCGIGTTNQTDWRGFSIRFTIGGEAVEFAASKPTWSIPADTHLTVTLQVGTDPPWTEQAKGSGHRLHWSMDQTAVQLFDTQFRQATTMTLSFPDGNEPVWTLSLDGSTAIDNTFGRCITDLTRRGQGSASTGGPPPTQPFGATRDEAGR